jgi:hypothetical protein
MSSPVIELSAILEVVTEFAANLEVVTEFAAMSFVPMSSIEKEDDDVGPSIWLFALFNVRTFAVKELHSLQLFSLVQV